MRLFLTLFLGTALSAKANLTETKKWAEETLPNSLSNRPPSEKIDYLMKNGGKNRQEIIESILQSE